MRIARLNGWSPKSVFAMDEVELAVAEDEARLSVWGPLEEMIALLVERVSALCEFMWMVNTDPKKRGRVPDELTAMHIARPNEPVEEERPRISWGEFAQMMRQEGWR
jgi:hypothetical protein